MAKGEDAIARKRNKANRKKLGRKESSKVSARVASIIASKKRRLAGKRRMCQGMCFSLPTPDDPFNDRQGKKDPLIQQKKKKPKKAIRVQDESSMKSDNSGNRVFRKAKAGKNSNLGKLNFPSKYHILCLKTIEDSLYHSEAENGEDVTPLLFNPWGVEFWNHYSTGMDILETSGIGSSVEQIAWIVSVAADALSKREKEGAMIQNPSLLYLVPTREKASEVRNVCKPLKMLGVHTVSIHYGAAMDHQIDGLKSCEPEFLVSTPERLLNLIALKAVDISGISMLVIDGFQMEGSCLDIIKSIKQSISGGCHTVLFSSSHLDTPAFQNILKEPIERFSLENSIASGNASLKKLKTSVKKIS